MSTSNILIRLERKEEYREVENLVRESFWNAYRPGCYEHYVLNQLRNDPAFVQKLDFVMYCIWRVPTAGFAEQNGRNAKLNSR